jgi:deoxycytidine triphosphate deaminase
MEITNNSTEYTIPLVVGRRLAQIVFFETEGIVSENYNGKYQSRPVTSAKDWDTTTMLPKLYLDKEIRRD